MLGGGHAQRVDEHGAGLLGLDDVVDVAALGRVVGVGELLTVVLDQLRGLGGGIRGLGDVPAGDDVHRALGAHAGDLRGGPGHVVIGTDVLAAHDVVGAAIGLAGDHRELGDGGLAV